MYKKIADKCFQIKRINFLKLQLKLVFSYTREVLLLPGKTTYQYANVAFYELSAYDQKIVESYLGKLLSMPKY